MSSADEAAWVGGISFVLVGGYIAAIVIAAAIVGLIAMAILSAVIAIKWAPKMVRVMTDWSLEIRSDSGTLQWQWLGPVLAGLATSAVAMFFLYEIAHNQNLAHKQVSMVWVLPALFCYFEAIALPWIAGWILSEDQAWLAYPVLITALPGLATWIVYLIGIGSRI